MILWSLQLSSPFMKSLTYGNLTLDVAQDRILVNVYLRVHLVTEDKGPACNVYGSSSLVSVGSDHAMAHSSQFHQRVLSPFLLH